MLQDSTIWCLLEFYVAGGKEIGYTYLYFKLRVFILVVNSEKYLMIICKQISQFKSEKTTTTNNPRLFLEFYLVDVEKIGCQKLCYESPIYILLVTCKRYLMIIY